MASAVGVFVGSAPRGIPSVNSSVWQHTCQSRSVSKCWGATQRSRRRGLMMEEEEEEEERWWRWSRRGGGRKEGRLVQGNTVGGLDEMPRVVPLARSLAPNWCRRN